MCTLIWWGCDNEQLPSLYPWSQSEQASLAGIDTILLPLDTQLEWQADSWLRPILSASKRLLLVLHDNTDSHHPIFDQIAAVTEGWTEARMEDVIRDPSILSLDDELPPAQTLPYQGLPMKTVLSS